MEDKNNLSIFNPPQYEPWWRGDGRDVREKVLEDKCGPITKFSYWCKNSAKVGEVQCANIDE